MPTFDDRVETCEQVLLDWCEANGVRILPDIAVCENKAGKLCGHNGNWLVQRIREGRSVPRYRTTGTRRFYRIRDIAIWLELGYPDAF
ncbi:hypothetical protein [Paraburkholderia aspalathi]|uniref:hypothetical protein n=1 Tax=Paraburkholderia aspalathi TaxID=1324617 RepID=UPI001BABF552|nr:hypothetical protein [Paraburkholderia aspalathi]